MFPPLQTALSALQRRKAVIGEATSLGIVVELQALDFTGYGQFRRLYERSVSRVMAYRMGSTGIELALGNTTHGLDLSPTCGPVPEPPTSRVLELSWSTGATGSGWTSPFLMS